jgi:hypothetical protein
MIIDGVVRDFKSSPLPGIEVSFDGKPITITDQQGFFRFSPQIADSNKMYLVSFRFPGLNSVSRNFHLSMGYSSLEITMTKFTTIIPYVMGIVDDFCQGFGKPVYFQRHVELFSSDKAVLADIGERLKANPGITIEVSGCWHTIEEKKKMEELRNAFTNYLIDKEGVKPERIRKGVHLCKIVQEHIKVECVRGD